MRTFGQSILQVDNLTVSYDRKPVLWNINFSLPQGSVTGIVGPNGAGKSTLLKSMMGLIPLGTGGIKIFDQEMDKVRHRVSYVPQRESVDWEFPASVYEVVEMGRYGKRGWFSRMNADDKEAINKALDQVGMKSFSNRQISELSGGQQQRVFLARALAQEADVYLLDEPFVGVDAATEKTIMELIHHMASMGKTLVLVHHDLQTVPVYFDHVVLLNMSLIACGQVSDVFTPENLETTYRGRLTALSEISHLVKEKDFPLREK